jgi:hypothetical protein
MRNEIIQKGAELGLWDAESLMAEKEAEDTKGTVSFGGGSILEAPVIDAARRDPFALGSFCLGSALLIGGAFGPEETFSSGAKDKMIKVGLLLEGLFLGRLTRGMATKTELAEKDVVIHRYEELVEAMEYDKKEAMEEASKTTRRQVFSTGAGIMDYSHPVLGGNMTNSQPSATTPAHGQSPIAMRRAETFF